jgi:hypothetical protein
VSYTGPGTGIYPLTQANGIYDLYESDGVYKQNQLIFNANARVNSRISLFGYYAYGHVNTNVLGTPSNPYNFNADWGRASYDIRHKVNLNGSILTLLGIRISPNIIFNSAPPWNIVEGVDQFGDGSTGSARPAFAQAGSPYPTCASQSPLTLKPCQQMTLFGNFLVNPPAGMAVIPVNAFNGFSQFNFNLRISRTWGFGESNAPANAQGNRGRGGAPGSFGGGLGGRGGGRGGPGGGGPGGFFGGGDASGKRYTVTAGIFFHNLFNNVNPAQIETNLLSPRLGEPLALANIGGFGGNLAAQAFNRRIDLSLRFSF